MNLSADHFLRCRWAPALLLLLLGIVPAGAQTTSTVIAETSLQATGRTTVSAALAGMPETTTSLQGDAAPTVSSTGRSTASASSSQPRLSPEEIARQQRLLAASEADNYREVITTPTVYRDLEVPVARLLSLRGGTSLPETAPRYIGTTESLTGPLGQQPRGSLTGKVIFCSGGHGWTNDNTSTTLWYTQRPALFGIVEDFGNLDQMNLYADACFRAGATVVPMRPVGHQPIERVIDNDSPHHARFQGPWYDSASTMAFTLWNEEVPYRFALASLQETALVRYRPIIPKADYYPVYTWVRAGADRVNQVYRIVSSGGATEVRVNHRMVGNGWVYLGEYYFAKGDSGYVEISNRVDDLADADGKHVVVADAIRFGNGMGDINRGGGISGRPREEEASRYWVERQLAQGVEPIYAAMEGSDQSTNVGTPPRMAAHMNRETSGTFFDRVFLSFHTNAVGGRGVCGLFCVEPARRPDYQPEWAELVAREVNAEMLSGRTKLPAPWSVFPKPAFGHINFGEIRRDYINNEMTATILELAYHDNPVDAMLLRMPTVRLAMARASLLATLKYFNRYSPSPKEIVMPPPAPRILGVRTDESSAVLVSWAPPATEMTSAPVETYRVYHSTDGFGFDGGVEVSGALVRRYDNLTTGTPHFFRVTAVNSGGESLPSQTLGTSVRTSMPSVLLVAGHSTLSNDATLTQTMPANLGSATGPGGEFVRFNPRMLHSHPQVPLAGQAMADVRRGFDSVTIEGLTSGVTDLSDYAVAVPLFGREPVGQGMLPRDLQSSFTAFLAEGGNLFLSGASVARQLDEAGERPMVEDRKFALETLGVRHGGLSTETVVAIGEPGTILSTATLELRDPSVPEFLPRPNDILTAGLNARPLLRYLNSSRNVAAIRTDPTPNRGSVVMLGFPFEEIVTREDRHGMMELVLEALGVEEDVPPAAVPILSEASSPAKKAPALRENRRRGTRRR